MVLMHLIKYVESLAWAGGDLGESEHFQSVCVCVWLKQKIDREGGKKKESETGL